MRIAELHTYPVKGGHRLDHDEVVVEPWGLTGDRRWMMIDPDGVGITQRDTARLTQFAVHPRPGGLRLTAPGLPGLDLDEPVDGPKVGVHVFRNKPEVPARLSVAGSAWCAEFLGRDARLVWQADPTGRTIPEFALPADRVSLADGYPVLLANAASLDAVNDWLAEDGDDPVPIHRFRPNLVVEGAPAWAEDDWLGGRLRIGELTFRVAKHCARCRVTTIDQETGEAGRQPLRVLGRHRRIDGGLMFAVNLIPDLAAGVTAVLRIGDAVTPME
ncbi:MOSC domain-containing protein [Actinoplanes oblitus]|uniref:MOSC domain-containing protein n=1 Tax=Actinoplanes oblitus TaxID=3040509 RepID=A0ABY8WKS1_9ACTN|nr:MOSC N-terminal beta barrel domain-containing protein [Actinoplanes oblitus]WIM97460.1 MOSC domain-containing protein [Actinoplanes oblitus]